MSIQDTTSAPARACGSCTMCCKVFKIAELNKPAGRWCVNARVGVGCVIHDQRPLSCQTFNCLWLIEPTLSDEWKPERARFVVSLEANGALQITCDPAQPAAWRREPYHAQIRRWAAHGVEMRRPVLLMIGDRASVILPNTEIELGELNAGDQVDLYHNGMRFQASVRKAGT
ncbi:MAG: hypothetical protein ACK4MV_15580 [Beijerinckiaceae bacterium]